MKAIITKKQITVSRCRECGSGSLDAREWQNCNKVCISCGCFDKIDVATAVFRDGYWEISTIFMPKPEMVSRLVYEIFCETPDNPIFIEIFTEDVKDFQAACGSFRIERQDDGLCPGVGLQQLPAHRDSNPDRREGGDCQARQAGKEPVMIKVIDYLIVTVMVVTNMMLAAMLAAGVVRIVQMVNWYFNWKDSKNEQNVFSNRHQKSRHCPGLWRPGNR